MPLDIHGSFFKTEIGLVLLSLGCMVLDIFLKDDARRGKTLASVAMIGVALIFFELGTEWGRFGSSFGRSFSQDGVALVFKMIFLLAGFFTLFMARGYESRLKRGHAEFILLVLFSLVGMCFLASANDFLLLFVALETMTLPLYIMTAYPGGHNASGEAGIKYLILGALSTAVFVYGLSFLYGSAGSTSYLEIQQKLATWPVPPRPFIFGMILILCSLGFKVAAVPFQLWVPDIYEGAPTPVAAFLAIGSKAAGFAALVRLLLTVFAGAGHLVMLFGVLSALTILYGNLGAIPQTNIKRLLGYSSIGHAGYLLMGLAAFGNSGREAILYYLVSYLFSTGGAFLVIVALADHLKADEIGEFAGLAQKSPCLAAGMLLSLLSLAGMPPLAGFFAKFYLLWASVKSGLLWLAVIGVLNVITSLYYYLKVVKVMCVDKPANPDPFAVSTGQKVMQYFSIFGILFLGIYPSPLVRLAEAAFAHFPK